MKYGNITSKSSRPNLFGVVGKGSYSTRSLDDSGSVRLEKGEQVSIDEVKTMEDRMLPATVSTILAQRLT